MSGPIHQQRCPHCGYFANSLKSSPTHDWICSDCVDRRMNRGETVELDAPSTPAGRSGDAYSRHN